MDSSRVALIQAVLVLAILGLPATSAADASVDDEYAVEDEQTETLATEEALETEAMLKSGQNVVHAANNGIDGPTCGARLDPCRSISQAIENASDGDVILVGPGRYGDLNGNGTLGESGEEAGVNGGMIAVNKRLRIVSRLGAAATILDGLPDDVVVHIRVNGVVFGLPHRGFTVMHGQIGFAITADRNVSVEGNIVRDNGDGMRTIGAFAGTWVSPVNYRVVGNLFTANSDIGMDVRGAGHVVRANVASGNGGIGFSLGVKGRVTGNVAVANTTGFVLEGAQEDTVFRENAAYSNSGTGVKVDIVNPGHLLTIQRNNFYGNGFSGSNCALDNQASNPNTVVAPNNYWGAATGPGPDPADDLCGDPTPSEPFASREFRIPTPQGW